MSAAEPIGCQFVQRFVDAYTDGELDPSTELGFERHLETCGACRDRASFVRSTKTQVAETVRSTRAPAELRAKIRDAVAVEAAGSRWFSAPLSVRVAVPLGLAATTLLAFGYLTGPATIGRAGLDVLPLDDIVRVHALPADVGGEDPQAAVRFLRPRVRFPVRPVDFNRRDARFIGARLSNVRERNAVAYFYEVGGRRVTVVAFPGEGGDAESSSLQRTRVGGREVSFRQGNGYTIPVRNQDGLNYAFTGDLDRQSLLQLAATARVSY